MGSWKARTNDDCRAFAERFRTAKSESAAASSFDRTGLRWSELLRLPYYDPTRFLVVDPMHTLFLGVIKEHFQGVLGYQKPGSKTSSKIPLPFSSGSIRVNIVEDATNPIPDEKAQRSSIRKLVNRLERPLEFDLEDQKCFDAEVEEWGKSSIHVSAFVYVGRGIGCLPSTMDNKGVDQGNLPLKKASKRYLARQLLSWVRPFSFSPPRVRF